MFEINNEIIFFSCLKIKNSMAEPQMNCAQEHEELGVVLATIIVLCTTLIICHLRTIRRDMKKQQQQKKERYATTPSSTSNASAALMGAAAGAATSYVASSAYDALQKQNQEKQDAAINVYITTWFADQIKATPGLPQLTDSNKNTLLMFVRKKLGDNTKLVLRDCGVHLSRVELARLLSLQTGKTVTAPNLPAASDLQQCQITEDQIAASNASSKQTIMIVVIVVCVLLLFILAYFMLK